MGSSKGGEDDGKLAQGGSQSAATQPSQTMSGRFLLAGQVAIWRAGFFQLPPELRTERVANCARGLALVPSSWFLVPSCEWRHWQGAAGRSVGGGRTQSWLD